MINEMKRIFRTESSFLLRKEGFYFGIAFVLLMILFEIGEYFPRYMYAFFLHPSGTIASLFTGARLESSEEGLFLLHRLQIVRLVPDCSGYSFWMILFSLAFWRAIAYTEKWHLLILLPVSYALAVLVNGVRITVVVYSSFLAKEFLPASFSTALHLFTGVLVFFPVLIVTYYFYEKRLSKVSRRKK